MLVVENVKHGFRVHELKEADSMSQKKLQSSLKLRETGGSGDITVLDGHKD